MFQTSVYIKFRKALNSFRFISLGKSCLCPIMVEYETSTNEMFVLISRIFLIYILTSYSCESFAVKNIVKCHLLNGKKIHILSKKLLSLYTSLIFRWTNMRRTAGSN